MPYIPPDLWQPVGVKSLESAAEEVVRSNQTSLVVAGPGAGKTELLAQRASFLLDTATCPAPRRILAISFKRDAAKNLAERVQKRCGDRAQRFDSYTLDAFAKGLVDRFNLALPLDWRPKLGYEVMTKGLKIEEIEDWLVGVGVSREKLTQISDKQIRHKFDQLCHGQVLPYSDENISESHRELGLLWWQEQLNQPTDRPSLTFPMLNRLAAFLLRQNPRLATALRETYHYVFLDEFQDTTAAQYDLIRAAFHESGAILTAVGDGKQRIMLWAGAMSDVFDTFAEDFSAARFHLINNFRSVPELVRMQRVIAQAVESGTPDVVAAKTSSSGGCAILEFRNAEQEADYLASLIEERIRNEGKKPRDFCVLVRQRTSQMIKPLQEALYKRNIKLRDETQLQELLAEPVIGFLLAVLRLATKVRDAEAWSILTNELSLLFGVDSAESPKIEREARALIRLAQTALKETISIRSLLADLVSMVGTNAFRAVYRQYGKSSYLQNLLDQFSTEFNNLLGKSASVFEAICELSGGDVIPAITIHKSKGLEFNSVIFLGLEDSQWWAFSNEPEEEKRGFFVAFSRAIEHVYFTYSDIRDSGRGARLQKKASIGDLYTILQQAGVEQLDCRNYDYHTS